MTLSILILTLLLPLSLALHTIPEVFQTFPLSHPSFTSLSARAVAVDNSGNVYVAGIGFPSSDHISTQPIQLVARALTHVQLSLNHTSEPTNSTRDNPAPAPPPPRRRLTLVRPTVFIARIDLSGKLAWLRTLPSNGSDSVSALLLHHNHVFVVGTSTAAISGATRTTAHGTPSVFVTKLTASGTNAWPKPLMFGSAGVDVVSAVAIDDTRYFPHLFVSGSVGGQAFPTAKRDKLDLNSRDSANPQQVITTVRAAKNASAVDVQAGMAEENRRRRRARNRVDSDLFLAKIDPKSGKLEAAVQLPLDRDNSADAIAVSNGVLYAAVNSFDNAPFDPTGTSALYMFRPEDLAYHAIHLPEAYNHLGDYVQSIAADKLGNLYLAAFALRGNRMEDGKFILRKYASADAVFEWEKVLGNYTKVEPRVSIAVGRASGNVFVAGHATGIYRNQDAHGGELLCLPLTVFSPSGRELMSWDRTSLFPIGYEEIAALSLDKDENVVYAGKWLNPSDELYDATVGTFGASSFTARAAKEDLNSPTASTSGSASRMASSTIGLICLAVGIALVLVGTATVMGRSKMLGSQGLVFGTADDSVRDDTDEELDRIDDASLHASQAGSHDVRLMLRNEAIAHIHPGGSSGPV